MCGVFLNRNSALEWNALCDPAATAMVYRAVPPFHRSIGLDVTEQVTMEPAEVKRKFEAPLLCPVVDFANDTWFEERKVMTFRRSAGCGGDLR